MCLDLRGLISWPPNRGLQTAEEIFSYGDG